MDRWVPRATGKCAGTRPAFSAQALRAAIDNRELINDYQPKVELGFGQVAGVECLVRWRHPAEGLALTVAINVSMDNLVSLDFPAFVTGHAAAEGVAPEDIVLEVTESRLMTDPRPVLECLMRLRPR